MRLIDADKLKEEVLKQGTTYILTIIDNAPTVYPICEDKACKYRANKRPQGKWIDHWSEDLQALGYRQCSKCKAGCQIYEHGTRKSDLPWIDGQQFTLERIHNYCPNCGAKMETEGEL